MRVTVVDLLRASLAGTGRLDAAGVKPVRRTAGLARLLPYGPFGILIGRASEGLSSRSADRPTGAPSRAGVWPMLARPCGG